jgi:hypothetical protein
MLSEIISKFLECTLSENNGTSSKLRVMWNNVSTDS